MGVLWFAIKLVVVAVVLQQLICFFVAFYETLNLPEARDLRLTPRAYAGALRAFVVETLGVVTVVLALPLGLLPWRRVPRLGPATRPPIVFVPGWAMNRACFLLLRRRLRRDGWAHAVGLNYRTLHGDLLSAAGQLRDAVETVCRESGAPRVVLIAHSMGGLVCRAYLRHLDGTSRAAQVVTLGTPHQGSKICALSLDPMVQDMRDGSAFLRTLAEDDPIPGTTDFTSIYASFDALVVPATHAQYPGVANIQVEGVGHVGLLWSRRVYELVRENLDYAFESASRQRSTSFSSQ